MSVYELCDPITPCISVPSDTGEVSGLPWNWVSWAVADGNYVSNIHASAIITPFSLINTKLFNINVCSASSFLLGKVKLLFAFSAWCLGLTRTLGFSIVIFWKIFATNKTKLLKTVTTWFLRTFWKQFFLLLLPSHFELHILESSQAYKRHLKYLPFSSYHSVDFWLNNNE